MSSLQALGAYGFRLEGAGARLLQPVSPDWPALRVSQESSEAEFVGKLEMDDRHATIPLIGGGRAEVSRKPAQATFHVQRLLTEDEIAHPYLGPIAAVHAHWLGRPTFHGGAMVLGGRAWGVLGRRQAGKSSLLAEADRRGIPIISDDLLVVDEMNVFAGPRSLDLREPAALHFKAGRPLGTVGQRERWRIDLGLVAGRIPLAGWILLELNSKDSGPKQVLVADRLAWLASSRSVKVEGADPTPLLRLAALPAVRLSRPERWDELSSRFDALLESISELAIPASHGQLPQATPPERGRPT